MATATTNPTVEEAESALAALHGRIAAGDPATTPAALVAAEGAVRFAQARREADERAARQRAEEERREALAALTRRLAGMDVAGLERARQALAAALDGYAAAVVAWQGELEAIRAEAAGFDGERGVALLPWPRYGVRLGGATATLQPYQAVVRDLAEDVVRRRFGPRAPFDLMRPPD